MPNKLELLIRKAGRDLADHQVCRLFKVPEEMSQTPCDFFGYTRIGQAILVEAKMVTRTALPIGSSNGLQPHQWNELCDAHRAGALALIVWANGGVAVCLSMEQAFSFSRGRKSIPWRDIPKKMHRPLAGTDAHLRLLEPWISVGEADPLSVFD